MIDLNLDLKPRLVKADDRVAEDNGCVAVVCGPAVYCAENVGNNVKPQEMTIRTDSVFEAERISEGILDGVVSMVSEQDTGSPVSLIPYCCWDNRSDKTSIRVWLKTE